MSREYLTENRFKPWFGLWLLKFQREEKEMKNIRKLIMEPRVAIGIIVIFTIIFWLLFEWLHCKIFEELAISLTAAFVLAVTVEFSFKYQIIADVFRTAFGHFLPKEIEEEVNWLFDIKFIATEHIHDFFIEEFPDNNEKVILKQNVCRTIQNVTNNIEEFPVGFALWEGFHKERESKIISFSYRIGKQKFIEIPDNEFVKEGDTIVIPDRKIKLQPHESIVLSFRTEDIKYRNDFDCIFFSTLTKKIHINFKVCKGLTKNPPVTSGRNSGELEEVCMDTFMMERNLLPGQAIRFHWWDENFKR